MTPNKLVILAGSLMALMPLCAQAREVQVRPVPPAQFNATTALVTEAVDRLAETKGGLAGYSVVIAADGHGDFVKTQGFANTQTKAPVTPSTAFYIASMTKSYTGLIAARLNREGVLTLTSSLADLWPNLALPPPLDAATITLDRLLSHSSGLDNQPSFGQTIGVKSCFHA